eukprot:CAMPEP_0201593720 /NCGR_PEP_ID=MMETSP0190_2-20130828/191242_1 /ASSEMBLY_ACC=CAM_ASM_000263 /TAXON_ID=37353 /ORGANISM="Rosalina sp." /LENGTH=147 /DNA_ID=CAMNT_0048053023 /DNA_START=187 /DNA_END=627 /DNA_ORIENTATION=-
MKEANTEEQKNQPNTQNNMELQIQTNTNKESDGNQQPPKEQDPDEEDVSWADSDDGEIKADEGLYYVQVGESVIESMPMILLQSVFIIRSYNDPRLTGDDLILIGFSVIASLFSVANKYVGLDENTFEDEAKSLSGKGGCPNCINYW